MPYLLSRNLFIAALLLSVQPAGLAAELQTSEVISLQPGNGVTFSQVDWPGLPQPVSDTGTGIMAVDLAMVRQSAGSESGFLNVVRNDSWLIRNMPVFSEEDYPYPEMMSFFPLEAQTGTDVVSLELSVTFSSGIITSNADVMLDFYTYEVTPAPLSVGGLPEPVVEPPPDPAVAAIPQPVLDRASVQVIQRGHPNVNAARNQCMPMAIANSLQYLENTTGLNLPQSHVPGLAPNGNSDGSLVGDVEAETTRAPSVTSRTNAGATGTWGLKGKLKFLARNGLHEDIQTRHFGKSGSSPNGDFTSGDLTETVNGNTARSKPFGKTLGIADLVNSMRDGQDCEVVYTYPNGGSHAVELVAAGISGGLPWTVTASDLAQTHQGDANDSSLGAGQGFEFSLMSDKDGDGFLEFPDGRELVTAYCQKYVGTPPQTVTEPVTVVEIDDPAGHSCCVQPPGFGMTITRDGSDLLIEGSGDGFPLRGWVESNGDFFATSITPVAGFPAVYSTIQGRFSTDGSAQGVELTIGVFGELFGTPITYILDIGEAADQARIGGLKSAAASQGDLLRVNEGETLTVDSGNRLLVNGLLYNEGSIVISTNAVLRNTGLIDNRGSISIQGRLEGGGAVESKGQITNDGVIEQTGAIHLHQSSATTNSGTWNIADSAGLANAGSLRNNATLNLFGRLSNRGLLDGPGQTEVKEGGRLDNYGELDSEVDNAGRVFNVCDAVIRGPLVGSGAVPACGLAAVPSGQQVVPGVVSQNIGKAWFGLDVDGRVLDYVIKLPGLDLDGTQTPADSEDDVIGIEIRRGSYLDNGSVAWTIMDESGTAPDLSVNAGHHTLIGSWTGSDEAPLTPSLVGRLLDSTLYLLVRTNAHPDGELRGQILADNDASSSADEPVLGMLFDRSRNGHGMDFQRSGELYFLTFYSYGDDGTPEWFIAIGKVVGDVFSGELLRVSYDAADSPPQTATGVGRVELEFGVEEDSAACADGTDRSTALSLARFGWEIDGESGDWCVEPLIVGGAPPSPDFTGHWFAGPADEGWGLTVYQQGDVLFAVLYFYDATGKPRWLIGSTQSFTNGDTLTMDQISGYCRDCPTAFEGTDAGTLTLTFVEPSQTEASNRVSVDVEYQGPEGGEWLREEASIRLLSDPAD
ncbi:MAG: CHRD domain-containing protein [Pseudomonadota bacterium]|nr:MAG: CHRD domain-containing protein [Pseudomonadota bacterium]